MITFIFYAKMNFRNYLKFFIISLIATNSQLGDRKNILSVNTGATSLSLEVLPLKGRERKKQVNPVIQDLMENGC